MKKILILMLAMMASGVCSAAAASHKADFYVSDNGSDEWSGTLASPAAGETDGPFATLARARDGQRHPHLAWVARSAAALSA